MKELLTADAFSFLDSGWPTQSAEGHECMKTAFLNYLTTKELDAMLMIDPKASQQFCLRRGNLRLAADHPLLKYVVQYIFQHAAQAEKHSVSQKGFRTNLCSIFQGCSECWGCLYDSIRDDGVVKHGIPPGPEACPIHVLAPYGLLTRGVAEKKEVSI